MSLYEELKGWQSGIGTLLGFVSVLVVALRTYRLNRKRDAELRFEEMVSVAAALYGEMILLRIEAASVARVVANVFIQNGMRPDSAIKFDAHFLEAQKISDPTLYKALAPRIGILPVGLVIAITAFHKNVQEIKNWLPLLVDRPDRGYSYSVLSVLEPAHDAVYGVMPCLTEIEKLAKIEKSTATAIPDMGKVSDVIAMEQLARDER